MGSANTDHGSWTRHLATLTFLLILPASAELTISESDSNLLGSPSRFSRTPSLLETPLPPSAIQSDRILKSILRSKQDDEEDDVLLASSISPVRKALTFQPDQSSGEDDNGANSLSSPRTAGVGSQPRDRKINAPNPRELVFRAIRERRKLPSSSRKGTFPPSPQPSPHLYASCLSWLSSIHHLSQNFVTIFEEWGQRVGMEHCHSLSLSHSLARSFADSQHSDSSSSHRRPRSRPPSLDGLVSPTTPIHSAGVLIS